MEDDANLLVEPKSDLQKNDHPDPSYATSCLDYQESTNPLVIETSTRLGDFKVKNLSRYTEEDLEALRVETIGLGPYVMNS